MTKAQTLKYLENKLKRSLSLKTYIFKIKDYFINNQRILSEIEDNFQDNIVIRSSSLNEDCSQNSNAGMFTSILNINPKNKSRVEESIKTVIDSLDDNEDNEVFVQKYIADSISSGVVLTADLDTLSSYYIINYSLGSETDLITSGKTNNTQTYIHFRDSHEFANELVEKVINSAQECEEILNSKFLDIEFAVDKDNNIYILQAREIVKESKEDLSEINLDAILKKVYKKIEKLDTSHPNLLGDNVIFGVMPDWNPAEIIGIRPKRLAISLYKELITDEIWAIQRANYGYRDLNGHPLLVSFLGIPYIDVRASFNSFVPNDLDDEISSKLINYYLQALKKYPKSHDKVEFDVLYSCYYFGINKKLQDLKQCGFTENEIGKLENSLLKLTNQIISPSGFYISDLKKIEKLEKKFNDIISSNLSTIDKIYWLAQDCKAYGTLPFAGIARAGFIAVQLLRSIVDVGIISELELDQFMKTLNTINKKIGDDLHKVVLKEMDKETFIDEYGHLRPGTYNILSSRYDENIDSYFSFDTLREAEEEQQFHFSLEQKEEISQLLKTSGLAVCFDEFIKFISSAIEGREYAKFIFTRSVSKIIFLIEKFGERFGFDKHVLAHLDFQIVKDMYSTLDHRDVKDIFRNDIDKNREFYKYTKAVKLPKLISSPKDIYSYYLDEEEANFITLNTIEAEVILEADISKSNIDRNIVFIESADPGYDFLFNMNIGGLITQYGGANSHMSIRCAELGIPAVIGMGEKNFTYYSKAKRIFLDCANKTIEVLY